MSSSKRALLCAAFCVFLCNCGPAQDQARTANAEQNSQSKAILEKAAHALGDGWAQVRAVRAYGTSTDSSAVSEFTWVDGWTDEHKIKKMTRSGTGARYTASSRSTRIISPASSNFPKPNLFGALLRYAPGAAIFLALHDQDYQLTAPFMRTEGTEPCAQIVTPAKMLWDGGVLALVCFSNETGLPSSAKIAIPNNAPGRPILFETVKFGSFVSQNGLIGPSQVTITRPGGRESRITINHLQFGTTTHDLAEESAK